MSAEIRAAITSLAQAPPGLVDLIDDIAIGSSACILVADDEADRAVVAEYFGVANDFGAHAPTQNWSWPIGLNVQVLETLP